MAISYPNKVHAATWVIDNDAAAGQPGNSGITNGSWTYRYGGMFNDHRISYGYGAYSYNTHSIGSSGRINAYAYINNIDFVGTAQYHFTVNGSHMGISKSINQRTAPGGYSHIGSISLSGSNRMHIFLSKAAGGAIGADAVKLTQ